MKETFYKVIVTVADFLAWLIGVILVALFFVGCPVSWYFLVTTIMETWTTPIWTVGNIIIVFLWLPANIAWTVAIVWILYEMS